MALRNPSGAEENGNLRKVRGTSSIGGWKRGISPIPLTALVAHVLFGSMRVSNVETFGAICHIFRGVNF